MIQQINLYQSEFLPQRNMFAASFMLQVSAIILVAMTIMYGYASQRVSATERELEIVARQETAAIERLQNLKPLITAVTGERSWSEQLDDALQSMQERQAVLSLVQGATHSETQGFSHHLRALARQDIEGLWLTRIVLSALGDKTRLEGRTLRAELVPLYVQDLTSNPPFAAQRFSRFRIERPLEPGEYALHFSMDTESMLAADSGSRP